MYCIFYVVLRCILLAFLLFLLVYVTEYLKCACKLEQKKCQQKNYFLEPGASSEKWTCKQAYSFGIDFFLLFHVGGARTSKMNLNVESQESQINQIITE